MTAPDLAAAIYIGLAALAIAFAIVAALNWADREVQRHVQTALCEQAGDWHEPTRTEVEADFFWHNFADVVDAHALPLSQSPTAQRIRDQIADNECRRFRTELDTWNGGAA